MITLQSLYSKHIYKNKNALNVAAENKYMTGLPFTSKKKV